MAAPHRMPSFQSTGLPKAPNMTKVATGPVARMLPTLVVVGAVSCVATYVGSQLTHSKNTYSKIFAQQNTPEVEAHRRAQLQVETMGDPRKSLFNVLGW
ncbi:hypothetical protein G7054_g2711 [Neopestalotiopsis clavispora]|nr:hypothetical protein G7054_g2711 [Neopestalotiopsis clavispora]